MKNTALLGILAVLVLEAGCMMGPKYKRPAVNVPQEYRTPEPATSHPSLVAWQRQWWQLYQDPVLTQLIHTAILRKIMMCAIAALECSKLRRKSGSHRSTISVRERRADIYSQQNAKGDQKYFPLTRSTRAT